MTIKQALEYAVKNLKENNIEDANVKAKILLADILDKPKSYLITRGQRRIKQWAKARIYKRN